VFYICFIIKQNTRQFKCWHYKLPVSQEFRPPGDSPPSEKGAIFLGIVSLRRLPTVSNIYQCFKLEAISKLIFCTSDCFILYKKVILNPQSLHFMLLWQHDATIYMAYINQKSRLSGQITTLTLNLFWKLFENRQCSFRETEFQPLRLHFSLWKGWNSVSRKLHWRF
jgi:hypothetical protein